MNLNILNHNPRLVVLTNALIFLITFTSIIYFRYIYPRKKINYLILIIIFSILPLISILRPGPYESGDMTIHIIHTIEFENSLKDTGFVPVWSENFNATYGYPCFLFQYQAPYLMSLLFHHIGFSYINSIKIVLIISYIFSGFFIYLWLKRHFKEKGAFLGSLIYLTFPYHLIDLHFRSDVGEIMAFMFLPISLYMINNFSKRRTAMNLFLCSISISFLIISHQAIALISFPIIIIYAICISKTIKESVLNFLPLFFGLLTSSYYWIPVLFEMKYTLQPELSRNILYLNIQDIFYSPFKFGFLYQGAYGVLKMTIGYMSSFIVVFGIVKLLKNQIDKKYRKLLFLTYFLLFSLLFLTTNKSKVIWDGLKLLKNIQFSYRLMVSIMFIISLQTAIIFSKIGKISFWIIAFLLISTSILNWANRGILENINDNDLAKLIPYSTYQFAGLQFAVPKWVGINNIWEKDIPEFHLEVLNGDASVKQIYRDTIYHKYLIFSKSKSVFKENTLYFPGWNLRINNQYKEIMYDDKNYPGIMIFNLDPGNYLVEFIFIPTNIRIFSFLLTVLTFSGLGLVLIVKPGLN